MLEQHLCFRATWRNAAKHSLHTAYGQSKDRPCIYQLEFVAGKMPSRKPGASQSPPLRHTKHVVRPYTSR